VVERARAKASEREREREKGRGKKQTVRARERDSVGERGYVCEYEGENERDEAECV